MDEGYAEADDPNDQEYLEFCKRLAIRVSEENKEAKSGLALESP